MENIPQFDLPWHAGALVCFYLLLITYAIFTVIFYYHWNSYSMSKSATMQTFIAYFLISLPLLAIMGLSLLGI